MGSKTKKRGEKTAKFSAYFLILICWLGLGGAASFLPLLIHGLENYVGATALRLSLITWLLLPITIGLVFMKLNRYTASLLIIDLFGWIAFTSWVWFNAPK